MPCIYEESPQEKLQAKTKKELDKLTAMLCEVCDLLDDGKLPEDIRHWWRKHQEQDRKRKARETRDGKIKALLEEEELRHKEKLSQIKEMIQID